VLRTERQSARMSKN